MPLSELDLPVLLLLDVGNTQTDVAVSDPDEGSLSHIWRFTTEQIVEPADWQSVLSATAQDDAFDLALITDIAISSVVPSVTQTLSTLFSEWLSICALIVRSDLKLGIQLAVDQPEQVGTDRLCNAAAAFQEAGGASIVVDAGTATKVEAISADGVFLGGAIAPGIGVSLEALVRRAAQLYDVPLEFPKNPIGVNTVEAVQSGLVIGHLGLIEGLVERFREQIGIDAPVILTGGYGHLFWQKSIVFAKFDPELTLRGLQRIWQLNR